MSEELQKLEDQIALLVVKATSPDDSRALAMVLFRQYNTIAANLAFAGTKTNVG